MHYRGVDSPNDVSDNFYGTISVPVGKTLSCNILGLMAYSTYNVSVRATNQYGVGEFSEEVTVRTEEGGLYAYAGLYTCTILHAQQMTHNMYVCALCAFLCTVPSVPLTVTPQVTASTSLQVSWSTPTFSNGPNLTYRVEYTGVDTENALNDSFFMTSFLESSTTSMTISDLVPFSTYTIGVRASTSVGAGPIAYINVTTAAAGE